mgnify:CR=1 FL=1
MGVINVLDKHVAELIAAGEVVERPVSYTHLTLPTIA